MQKQNYLEPAMEVLSFAPIKETMETTSITMGVSPLTLLGVDMGSPSDLSGESYTTIFE